MDSCYDHVMEITMKTGVDIVQLFMFSMVSNQLSYV
jgi:hypothetical protein